MLKSIILLLNLSCFTYRRYSAPVNNQDIYLQDIYLSEVELKKEVLNIKNIIQNDGGKEEIINKITKLRDRDKNSHNFEKEIEAIFVEIAKIGDLDLCREVVKVGIKPDQIAFFEGRESGTALEIAVDKINLPMFELLVESGSKISIGTINKAIYKLNTLNENYLIIRMEQIIKILDSRVNRNDLYFEYKRYETPKLNIDILFFWNMLNKVEKFKRIHSIIKDEIANEFIHLSRKKPDLIKSMNTNKENPFILINILYKAYATYDRSSEYLSEIILYLLEEANLKSINMILKSLANRNIYNTFIGEVLKSTTSKFSEESFDINKINIESIINILNITTNKLDIINKMNNNHYVESKIIELEDVIDSYDNFFISNLKEFSFKNLCLIFDYYLSENMKEHKDLAVEDILLELIEELKRHLEQKCNNIEDLLASVKIIKDCNIFHSNLDLQKSYTESQKLLLNYIINNEVRIENKEQGNLIKEIVDGAKNLNSSCLDIYNLINKYLK